MFCSIFVHLSAYSDAIIHDDDDKRHNSSYYIKSNFITALILGIIAAAITLELTQSVLSDGAKFIPIISFIVGFILEIRIAKK